MLTQMSIQNVKAAGLSEILGVTCQTACRHSPLRNILYILLFNLGDLQTLDCILLADTVKNTQARNSYLIPGNKVVNYVPY
jgi:hypothetical protein